MTITQEGLISATTTGIAAVIASADGVVDTVGISVAKAFRGTDLTTVPNTAGEVTVFTDSYEGLQVQIRVEGPNQAPDDGARVYYQERSGESRILVRGDGESTNSTVMVQGDLGVAAALLQSSSARFGAEHGQALALLGGLELVVAVKLGVKVVAAGMFTYQIARTAAADLALREKNSLFIDDWSRHDRQCATVEDIASFIYNELEQTRTFKRQLVSVALFAIGGASRNSFVEAATVVADETVDLLPRKVFGPSDLLLFAEQEYGIPSEDFQTPSGRVRVIIREGDPLPQGTLTGSGMTPPIFVGVDPYDDGCAGRVPERLDVAAPSSVSTGSSNTITAQVTSEWGNGVEGVPVQFSVAAGNGTLSASSATTDAQGMASVAWTAPGEPGEYAITVSARNGGAHLGGSPTTVGAVVATTPMLGLGFDDEEWAHIPAGTFEMGSSKGSRANQPVHTVNITKSFEMLRTEVTEIQAVLLVPGLRGGDRKPAMMYRDLSAPWGIFDLLRRLEERYPQYRFSLPTEAEWEYAARAGSAGDYGGTGILDDMGWYAGNSDGKLQDVALKEPNAWGLYDMHGNAPEMVRDWFDPDYYKNSPLDDPVNLRPHLWYSGHVSMRGGSYRSLGGDTSWEATSWARGSCLCGLLITGRPLGARIIRRLR